MNIPKRKKPWEGPIASWMCADRLEHYLRLRTIDLDRAAFLAVGMLPEKYEPPWAVMWFDGPLLSSDKQGWEGDNADAIWDWMEDAKAQWIAAGGANTGIDLRAFFKWVEATYERPYWLAIAEAEGLLDVSTAPPVAQFEGPTAETAPSAPPFPEAQGDWYECFRPPRLAPVKGAIQLALGLIPNSNPLRWVNNRLVTEPYQDHSMSGAIKFWTDMLDQRWREGHVAAGSIDVAEFIDWVSRAFGRPKWVARAEQMGLWPPEAQDAGALLPEDPTACSEEWSVGQFGPENSPEAIAQRLEYWLRYDTWTHTQAILILLGIDPDIEATSFTARDVFRSKPSFFRLTFLNGIAYETLTWGFMEEGFSVSKNGTTLRMAGADIDQHFDELARQVEEMNAVFLSGSHSARSEFGYYLRWAAAKGFAVNAAVERHLLRLRSQTGQASAMQVAPVSRFNAQENAILDTIKRLGRAPQALPPFKPGAKKWIKADVWDALRADTNLFVSRKVFDKSWERLRQADEIATSDLLPQIGEQGET